MKPLEKVLLALSVLIVCAGAICLALNQDIYREVGNAHPAKGYAEFVGKLSDEEFVLSRYERWEDSDSWVLRDLHRFLTVKDAELGSALILTQAVISFAFYYSFACIPLVLVMAIRTVQRRRGKEQQDA